MTAFLTMSSLYAPTLKETPVEADIVSHQLLLRAGMIRKSAAGIYSFLPLGWRSLNKIENIVREEMDAIGSQEMRMTVLQPSKIWHESGRWDDYGPELMRLSDRHDRSFCLGPTHEELITTLIRGELRSYKELPVSLYQIQVKFRDEIRPRFGLLRGREFVMKDAYSFHADEGSLNEHYEQMGQAYGRICERLALKYYPVMADSGQIGGSETTEFMAVADAGEAEIVFCECGFAGNTEVAPVNLPALSFEEAPEPLDVHTPDAKTIDEVSGFLGLAPDHVVKSMLGKDEEGKVYLVLLPGGHSLNDVKVEKYWRTFELLSDEEIEDLGLERGFVGPVGIDPNITVIADVSLKDRPNWIVGANKRDHHLKGALPGRDFEVDLWYDLATVSHGDLCPTCGKPLSLTHGIEVSQIFQLGSKYSVALGATFTAEDGTEKPFLMGCYGVGISRSLAAVVEQHSDENGICWPVSVAPAEVAVIPLVVGDENVFPVAESLAKNLYERGVEIVFDDRDERAGVKFADADLIGWPLQLIVGKRGLENGIVEVKDRTTGEKKEVFVEDAAQFIVDYLAELR